MSSIPQRIEHRRFLLIDKLKQSTAHTLYSSEESEGDAWSVEGHSARWKEKKTEDEKSKGRNEEGNEQGRRFSLAEIAQGDPVARNYDEESIREEEEEEKREEGKGDGTVYRRHTMGPIVVETVESEEEGAVTERMTTSDGHEDTRLLGSTRRTSDVKEGLLQETDDDYASTVGDTVDRRASLSSLIGIQKTEEDEGGRGTILKRTVDPSSKANLLWMVLQTTAFLYNAICVPLRSSYPYQTNDNLIYWLIVDYICDLVYLADILIWKPRRQFMRGGIPMTCISDTTRNYFKSRDFRFDLLSIMPTDMLYMLIGPIPIVRVNRFLHFDSFGTLFDMLDNSFSNPYAIRIARTLSYMIYIIHVNSCVYYVLSAWQAFGQIAYRHNGKWYLNKWVYNNQGNAYIRCFYFTAAVATSTGNNPAPTNVIEYIYMTFSWMMGVFVFALLLGQIRDIVSNASRNQEEYRRKMDNALNECHRLNLPTRLTSRVRSWFIYTWEQHKTLDEKRLIDKLPLKLQTDLALSVHYATLSKVKLFQDCERALLRDLVLKLRPVIFLPGDMVCKKGDVGKEMYIVNQGVLEVVGGEFNEKVFATLEQGSVFGEISLLAIGGNNRRTASIRAKGYATLFVLAKDDLQDVIKYYPQAQMILKRKAAEMLNKDKKAEGAAAAEKNLQETCKLNVNVTPKMLHVVAKVLPDESETTKTIKKALEERRPSRNEWQEHDISDISEDEASQIE